MNSAISTNTIHGEPKKMPEAVSSTLHQKVKYPSEGQVKEILGDQSMARQCLVAAIQHKLEVESLAHLGKEL